ncbi:hypothetical protein RLIN73S_06207 [Rhodanobacter lindaniclasticus]
MSFAGTSSGSAWKWLVTIKCSPSRPCSGPHESERRILNRRGPEAFVEPISCSSDIRALTCTCVLHTPAAAATTDGYPAGARSSPARCRHPSGSRRRDLDPSPDARAISPIVQLALVPMAAAALGVDDRPVGPCPLHGVHGSWHRNAAPGGPDQAQFNHVAAGAHAPSSIDRWRQSSHAGVRGRRSAPVSTRRRMARAWGRPAGKAQASGGQQLGRQGAKCFPMSRDSRVTRRKPQSAERSAMQVAGM